MGKESIGYWHNLFTGAFLEGLASNWQAAFLQLASLILFSEFFYQRGAPHSRDPLRPISKRKLRETASRFSWLYRNSFFLAFLLLFVLSLAMHVVVGAGPTMRNARSPAGRRSQSRHFCFRPNSGLQPCKPGRRNTWRSRIFVVFSIFLRQQNSAESKPLESSDEATGEANK